MTNDLDKPWRASWIWPACEDPARPNTYVYFRRAFQLEARPAAAAMRISADTSYQLFVNGTFVGRGPVLIEPRWQTYDEYDVQALLRQGENVLAVIVYHYGNGPENPGRNTHFWSRGGLLAQLDCDPGSLCVGTDAAWQTLEAPDRERDMPKIDRMTYCERINAGRTPEGWMLPGGAAPTNQGWRGAQIVTLNALVEQWNWNPCGHAVLPWMRLDPRPLPYFKLESRPPAALIHAGEVRQWAEPGNVKDLAIRMALEQPLPSRQTRIDGAERLWGGGPCEPPVTIEPQSDAGADADFDGLFDATLSLDAGRIVNARVQLDVEAPAGTLINVGYSQILVDGRVVPYLSNRTPMADQFVTRAGRQRFETFHWRNFRYLQLTFRNQTAPLRIHRLEFEEERYPYEKIGSFECSDEMLNWIWGVCARTVELCTYDRFMDNPSRERREYSGDILCMLHGIYAAFGHPAIVDKYFDDLRRSFLAYGIFPHTVLGNIHEEYSIYSESPMQLAHHLWENYRLTGDARRLKQFFPPLAEFLALLAHHANKDGLIEKSPFTNFVDWAHVERRGLPLVINSLYAWTLSLAAQMAEVLGEGEQARQYQEQSRALQSILIDRFWDGARGVFFDAVIDGRPDPHVSEHSNFQMMLFGMTGERQRAAIERCLNQKSIDIGRIEPMYVWACEGLFQNGLARWGVDLLRQRYGRVKRQGLETVPEVWNLKGERYKGYWRTRDSRSAVQAGGVSASFLLSRYILGIEPAAPGFAEIRIAPQPADLEWARGVWPSVKGPIRVQWRRVNDAEFHLDYEAPQGCKVTVIPPEPFKTRGRFIVNGQLVARHS